MAIPVKTQWLSKVGGVEVERIAGVKRSNTTGDLSVPPKGVLHTTEGGWAGSLSVFVTKTGTPTFMAGFDTALGKLRVAQFMPIGEMSLTLVNEDGGTETNREVRVQIECLGFTQFGGKVRWFLGADKKALSGATKNLIADLVYQASEAAGIPHKHGGEGFGKRSVSRWDSTSGWYGHSEVPENFHQDPGNEFAWADLFSRGERWTARLVSKDGLIKETDQVRGNEIRVRLAKFVAFRAGHYARLAVTGKRPRFLRHKVR